VRNKDAHIKQLEDVIKQMLRPLKNIPFSVVIEALSNCKVIPFNADDEKDQAVLQTLVKVAIQAGNMINRYGIHRQRANEVGNDIEPYVKKELRNNGYNADIPKTSSGKRKATGYPDIQFSDEFGRINYLECKTYNIENVATTQRSFYFSPSDDFKICHDAHHFIISYEVYVDGRDGDKNIYKCNSWKVLSIEDLSVDVKYEFNSDNVRLYSSELVLAEDTI